MHASTNRTGPEQERRRVWILMAGSLILLGSGFAAGMAFAPRVGSNAARAHARVGAEGRPVAVERDEEGRPAGDTGNRQRAGQSARLAVAASALGQVPQLRQAPHAQQEPAPRPRQRLRLDEAPAPVQQTLKQLTLGRLVEGLKVERREYEGQPIYKAEFHLDGAEHEYHLDEQGKVRASEWDVPVGDLPAAVSGGIQASVPGAVVLEAEREQIDGTVFFEVDVRVDGQDRELHIGEDGKLLRQKVRQ